MIEIARALKQSACQNEFTYILVALDMEETGTQGAAAFVQDFLVNTILKPMGFPQFQVGILFWTLLNSELLDLKLQEVFKNGAIEHFLLI